MGKVFRPKGDEKALEAWLGVWNSGLMLRNAARHFFRDKGATETQFHVMVRLKYADHPVTQKELSEMLMVDKSDLTGLVDRMEERGFLRRTRASGDRRSYHLELKEPGIAFLEETEGPYRELITRIMSCFDDEKLDRIISVMTTLQNALDSRCNCTAPEFPLRPGQE